MKADDVHASTTTDQYYSSLRCMTDRQNSTLQTSGRVQAGHAVPWLVALPLLLSVALTGCAQFTASPSLGDWMRGNHKPITPDDSTEFPAPSLGSLPRSLESSAVQLDGSAPRSVQNDDGLAGEYIARQYPGGIAPADGQPNYPVYPGAQQPGAALQSPPPAAFAQQAPGGGVQANPYTIQPGNAPLPTSPQNIAPQQTFAPQQGPATATGSLEPPVVFQQNLGTPGITRPTYVPGEGTDFPPIGTAPIYTPTLRYADLIINGYPARTGRIMVGGAVNSDAGVTGQITVDERNFDITRWPASFQRLFTGQPALRGAGETFRLEAAPGSDFDRYTLQWATPNLFNYLPFSFSVSGFLFDRRFNDWDEQRLGGRLSFGYRITQDLSLTFGVSGQEVEITNPSSVLAQPLNDVLGENELYTGSLSLKHDTRNSPIQASKGHYFEFSYEKAFGDFDYSRFELEYRKYWLLTERIDESGKQTISYSTQLGFSGDETPVFENFFAGGYATIRGFDFRGASPVDNGVEVGGRFQWLNSVEYMFPITADDAFRGVAFVDFGTVEQDIEIDADNFRVAPGVGVRVAIPALGPAPLAFDFAFPVAQAATDDERIFSFYMSLIR